MEYGKNKQTVSCAFCFFINFNYYQIFVTLSCSKLTEHVINLCNLICNLRSPRSLRGFIIQCASNQLFGQKGAENDWLLPDCNCRRWVASSCHNRAECRLAVRDMVWHSSREVEVTGAPVNGDTKDPTADAVRMSCQKGTMGANRKVRSQ